ncbi:MAG: thiolase family protein [Pseudoxanthomonas sp.]
MNVYVLGTALHPPSLAQRDMRLEELAWHTARAALADAGISRRQLDHLTIGACDELDGRPISSMLMAAPTGGFMTDEMKVTDSGAMALCLGYARIKSGEFHLGLVSSWCKPSKTDVDAVMRLRGDPFFSRPLDIDMTTTDGLFAQAVSNEFGVTEEEAAQRATAAYRRARLNPRALPRDAFPQEAQVSQSDYVAAPLRDLHRAPLTDGAAMLVLASEEFVRKNRDVKPLARITGVGWASDSYRLGSGRLRSMQSARKAWAQALEQAGAASARDFDVIEVESQTSWHEAAYVRALGIDDETKVSPSGGPFAQNPLFCTGLVGAVEAVLQVSGRAGAVQRAGVKRAAAHSCHGYAQQGNTVVCFGQVEGAA